MATASDSRTARPQENNRACGVSARLVKITGTRAPITNPATCAPAMNANSLYIMLPASILGAMRMSAFPATGELHALHPRRLLVHRNVEIQRSVDDRADDLLAIRHFGERGRVHGRRHLRIHRLDGREDRDLGLCDPQRPRQDDGVLDDVTLLIDIGSDIHRGVADDDATGIGRRCDEKAVAQKTVCSQPALLLDDGMHVLIGMQAAFHERADLAAAGQIGGDSG